MGEGESGRARSRRRRSALAASDNNLPALPLHSLLLPDSGRQALTHTHTGSLAARSARVTSSSVGCWLCTVEGGWTETTARKWLCSWPLLLFD